MARVDPILAKGAAAVTVYVEQIVAVNFLADAALLRIAGRLWGCPSVTWRWACASLAGALWAAAATVPALGALRTPWAWAAGLGAVTAIGFPSGGWRQFVRLWATLCGATLLAGGAAMALLGRMGTGRALACTPLGIGAAALTARFALPGWHAGARRFRAWAACPGGRKLAALIDSGNSLVEPLSGLPVIVAGSAAARALLGGRAVTEDSGGIRWIPCATASGGTAMPALPAAGIRVRLGGEWRPCGPVYVAVAGSGLPAGVSALIPPLPHLLDPRRTTWRRCAT